MPAGPPLSVARDRLVKRSEFQQLHSSAHISARQRGHLPRASMSDRPHLLLLDTSCLPRLQSPFLRTRFRGNLRATGKEFWPNALNVLEVIKSRDRETRTRLLTTLAELAGTSHALTLPTEGLRRICEALAHEKPTIDWSEPRLTRLFRDPDSVTDEEAAAVRAHLLGQEDRFNRVHEKARTVLRPAVRGEGSGRKWASAAQFLNDAWPRENLSPYVTRLWELWGFPAPAPVEQVLSHEAWQLFFDAWGATMYARSVAHPQPALVQFSDLQQLVYFGSATTRMLVTQDHGFRNLANSMLRGRYNLARVVPLDDLLT